MQFLKKAYCSVIRGPIGISYLNLHARLELPLTVPAYNQTHVVHIRDTISVCGKVGKPKQPMVFLFHTKVPPMILN